MRKKNAQVVIVRKDKRMHKLTHLVAFAVTGGVSGAVTAVRAAQIGAYNARTRKLAAEAEPSDDRPSGAEHEPDDRFSAADHERALKAGQALMRKRRSK